MSNPKLAIDALLETDAEFDSSAIFPISVARYALLELVESPFFGMSEFSYMNVIPSWYVMTQPMEKLKGYNSKNVSKLIEDANDAADSVSLENIVDFTKCLTDKLTAVKKVSPESDGGKDGSGSFSQKGKKAATAG